MKPRSRNQCHTVVTSSFLRPTSNMNCWRFNSGKLMLQTSLLQISLHYGMTFLSRFSHAVSEFKVLRFTFAWRKSIVRPSGKMAKRLQPRNPFTEALGFGKSSSFESVGWNLGSSETWSKLLYQGLLSHQLPSDNIRSNLCLIHASQSDLISTAEVEAFLD